MKKTILALLIPISIIHANDIPVLKAGQNISADQLNEIFTVLQKSTPEIKGSNLIGSYVCTHYTNVAFTNYTISPDGFYRYYSYDAVFNDDGDGTFSWSRDHALLAPGSQTGYVTDPYEVSMNKFYTSNDNGGLPQYTIVQDGDNYRFYKSRDTVNPPDFQCINKKLLSPIATDLLSTALNDSVTLTWTDNSTDEIGFKVLRKDSLTGAYSVIDTVAQDVTSYTDDALADGTYWYRVQVTNSNGDSLGSNVTKVVVSN